MSEALTGVVAEVEDKTIDADGTPNYLEALVGDGKKYKSEQDLAKAYINADIHLRELRDKLDDKEEKINEVIEAIRKGTVNTPVAPTDTPVVVADKGTDIAKTVNDLLTQREREAEMLRVRNVTYAKLEEVYGSRDAWVKAIKSIVDTSPHLKDALNTLADTDPDACVQLITLKAPKPEVVQNTPAVGASGSANILLSIPKGLTWEQARKIRKENPKLYNSPEFKKAMEQAVVVAQANGKDFFAT